MIEDIGLGVIAFVLYAAVGTVATIGMGKALMSKGMRSRLAHRTASVNEWFAFGTVWILWPMALGISGVLAAVVYPAKLVGKVSSYAFRALESGDD